VTSVIGRETGARADRPTGHLGSYRAVDGSSGAPLYVDLDRPHAALVVGKRGYGKSYTVGVLAEELARTRGLAPVVVDPMGAFRPLAATTEGGDPAQDDSGVPVNDAPSATRTGSIACRVVDAPTVAADALDGRAWCDLLDLSPEAGAGTLVWRAASEAATLEGMREFVAEADAAAVDRRAAINHLDLAASWGVFDPDGLDAPALATGAVTVLDVSGLDRAPSNAVVRAVAGSFYRARVEGAVERLPWLLVDEAHAFFDGVAGSALERLLTRGRAPGVSLVVATQRPGAVPSVAVSQSDLLVSHRLTSETDIEALERARPTYAERGLAERLPERPGEVLIVDDATETVHTARIRSRETPHGGDAPAASDAAADE